MNPMKRYLPLCFFLALQDSKGATILLNGDFTGSLLPWTASGTVFNTGDNAVLSDDMATLESIFQTGMVPSGVTGFGLTFDFLNSVSTTLLEGFLPDTFFATLYLGSSSFGPTLEAGTFDVALGLFDMDSNGVFNVASGATFGPSPKGVGWSRISLAPEIFPGLAAPGFATVAFELHNLNGIGSDSVVAVDNVSLIMVVPEPHHALLLLASCLTLFRRRRDISNPTIT